MICEERAVGVGQLWRDSSTAACRCVSVDEQKLHLAALKPTSGFTIVFSVSLRTYGS